MFREGFEQTGNPSAVSIPHTHTHTHREREREIVFCCESYGVPQVCVSLQLVITCTNTVQTLSGVLVCYVWSALEWTDK